MRRARIKAVANVPVRRKPTQESSTAEPIIKNDEKVVERNTENVSVKAETNVEFSPESGDSKSLENVKEPRVSSEVTVQSVEKRDCLVKQTLDPAPRFETEHVEPICKIQNPQKSPALASEAANDSNALQGTSQKPPTSSLEGSPIKLMQSRSCFMRPTPRLDGGGRIRRNSVQGSGASASESEDDSKRSTCSVAQSRSTKDNTSSTSTAVKMNLGQKRRMVVSESARKLAEARREFFVKHENKSPDKSKLTMYDLIYYNPASNPMAPKPIRPAARKMSTCSITEKDKEEEMNDEPAEMLVPQVKVGPNGQLIIDEQSLVIDQYKAQENIDRSDIIVDEDTTGNGFYKRRPKSKEWSKWETIKFYKALNTYGTDFLLMQSVFPKRTRQELKLKYKKEERLNYSLIEKALLYQEFDTEALEKNLASFEETIRKETESEKVKKEPQKGSSLNKKRKRCSLITEEVNCENEENTESHQNSNNEQSDSENARITITKPIKNRPVCKRNATKHKAAKHKVKVKNVSIDDDSDSDKQIYKAKPTRSGRVPKRFKKVEVIDNKDEADQDHTHQQSQDNAENHKEIDKNNSLGNKNERDFGNLDTLDNSEIIIQDSNSQGNHEKKVKVKKISVVNESDGNRQVYTAKPTRSGRFPRRSKKMKVFDDINEPVEDHTQNKSQETIVNKEKINENDSQGNKTDKYLHKLDISKNSEIISPDNDNQKNHVLKRGHIDIKKQDNENPTDINDQSELSKSLGIDQNKLTKEFDGITHDLPNLTNLKPGSLVVLKKDRTDEPGKTTLQVYIVDANNPNCKDSLVPIDLSPEILQTVTQCIKDIEPQNISVECNKPQTKI